MAIITTRGLRRHLDEEVRVGVYGGILAIDDRGFYLRDGEEYRVQNGDQIGFRTSHPRTPVMEYQIDLSR